MPREFTSELNFVDVLEDIANFDDSEDHTVLASSTYVDNEHFAENMKQNARNITILSSNICSINAKFERILVYLEHLKSLSGIVPTILCFQEAWLTPYDDVTIFNISNYKMVSRGSSASKKGGLITYIHESLKFNEIKIEYNGDLWEGLHIEIFDSRGKKFIVSNVYRPPRYHSKIISDFTFDFSSCFDKLSKRCSEVVAVGDYNIDLLKISENNSYRLFFEALCSLGMLPRITHPTRVDGNSRTLIDNAFCKVSCDLSDLSAGILVDKLSDHFAYFLIFNHLEILVTKKKDLVESRSFKQIDCERFREELGLKGLINTNEIPISKSANEIYEDFSEKFDILLNKHFPVTKRKFCKYKDKKNKWITDGILRSLKYRDNLLKRSKKLTGRRKKVLDTQLKNYSKILNRCTKNAKKLYYNRIFQTYKNNIRKTWEHINAILGKSCNTEYPEFFSDASGNKITDFKLIADSLNDYFSSIGQSLAEEIDTGGLDPLNYLEQNTNAPEFSFHCVSEKEISGVINNLKSKKSSGVDGVSSHLLKFINKEITPILTFLINTCILNGAFPDKLKIAKVVALHKKGDKSIFSNYRPISLLPCFSKIFERILHNQIYSFFETNQLFSPTQFGFRKKHSTDFAAITLMEKLMTRLDKGIHSYVIFMDLSKAFDTIDHGTLIRKLAKYNFSTIALKMITSYLMNRYQYVHYRGSNSSLRPLNTGVPQGSILGPLLFLVYINDLNKASSLFETLTYADDSTLIYSPTERLKTEELALIINDELKKFNSWFRSNKLSLNISKTNYVIFHATKKTVLNVDLNLNGVRIERVKSFKFLGLLINENINWNDHIKSISIKISRAVGILNKLKFYLPQTILLTLYFALIHSHFNNHLLLWGNTCDTIHKLQKKAVRIISREPQLSHSSPLFKTLKIIQIPDLYNLALLKFYYKYKNKQLPLPLLKLDITTNSECHPYYKTRHSENLVTPIYQHVFFRKSVTYNIVELVNSLAPSIRDKISTHSLQNVAERYKNYVLERYPIDCSLPFCYVCLNYRPR